MKTLKKGAYLLCACMIFVACSKEDIQQDSDINIPEETAEFSAEVHFIYKGVEYYSPVEILEDESVFIVDEKTREVIETIYQYPAWVCVANENGPNYYYDSMKDFEEDEKLDFYIQSVNTRAAAAGYIVSGIRLDLFENVLYRKLMESQDVVSGWKQIPRISKDNKLSSYRILAAISDTPYPLSPNFPSANRTVTLELYLDINFGGPCLVVLWPLPVHAPGGYMKGETNLKNVKIAGTNKNWNDEVSSYKFGYK